MRSHYFQHVSKLPLSEANFSAFRSDFVVTLIHLLLTFTLFEFGDISDLLMCETDSSDSIECNSNISLTRETTLNSPNVLSQKPQNTNDIEQKKHSKRSLLRRAFTRSDKKRSRLSNSTTEHGASESSAVSSQGVSRINQENQKPWHKYNFFRRAFTSSDKEPMAVPSTRYVPEIY